MSRKPIVFCCDFLLNLVLNSRFRYCTKPTELIVQSLPQKDCDVSAILRDLVLTKKYFLLEHRYDPFEIYSDEFEDELKAIPDPKKEPIECLDQLLSVLDEFGPWCADRAALNLIAKIEKSKIKTPYERHYLLLCLVSTTLIQIRAFCEQVFQHIPNDKECIEMYSSPKALRLLEILRQFKPEKVMEDPNPKPNSTATIENSSRNTDTIVELKVDDDAIAMAKCVESESTKKCTELDGKGDHTKESEHLIGNSTENVIDEKHVKVASTFNKALIKSGAPHGGKKGKGSFMRQPRVHNHNHQNDPNALCGLLLCNSMFSAKILFSFLAEMTKNDPDLEYLSVQYTGDRLADPVTESKQFENEHRKQEEVLKRFRMHTCNLLIGTSVLEEGIELPKCNLVIRWNLPTTYRSYVQCKGRARAQRAFHIIMVSASTNTHHNICNEFLSNKSHRSLCCPDQTVDMQCFDATELKESHENGPDDGKNNCDQDTGEDVEQQALNMQNFNTMENETEDIVKLLAQYMQIEKILLKKCSNQEPSLQDLAEADLYTHLIKPYQPIKSIDPNTSFVSLATAVVLVNKYCAKLPSDTFTKLTPLWRCCKTFRGNQPYYQYTVRLPINSPVKQDIYVSIEHLCLNQNIKSNQYNHIL